MTADWMAWFYRLFWGPNLHHGYFDRAGISQRQAEQKLKELLARRVGIAGGEDVLEVGFGFGETAMWLAGDFDCRVIGITISPAEQRIARFFARRRGLSERARFRILDAANLGRLPAESFDRVWCLECAEFLADKPRLLGDMGRRLRPGGRAVLCGLMQGPRVGPADHARYVEPLLAGFSMPPYASLADHMRWFGEAGFVEVTGEDLTRQVLPTGDRGARLLARPDVRLLCRLAPAAIHRNLETFPRVFEAYRQGALSYGLVTGSRP